MQNNENLTFAEAANKSLSAGANVSDNRVPFQKHMSEANLTPLESISQFQQQQIRQQQENITAKE